MHAAENKSQLERKSKLHGQKSFLPFQTAFFLLNSHKFAIIDLESTFFHLVTWKGKQRKRMHDFATLPPQIIKPQ